MMKKTVAFLSAAALFGSLAAGSASAFNDLSADQKEPIMALKQRGIVSGVDGEHFVPMGKASYAQTVHMLVKGLNLNIDAMRFIKKPEASDYYTNVPDDAWYAESFVIAQLNDLPIPKDVDPNGTITREQYADLLIHAIDTKGMYPVVNMLVVFADQDEIDPKASGSVQRMVLHKLIKLGEDAKFYPRRELTRGEAAVWLHGAIKFVESHANAPKPAPQEDIQVTVEKVNDDVNKVVLTRGEKPTGGYGITISGIRFEAGGRAVITYTLSDPKPDSMNTQAITEPTAETYVSSKYKPVAEPAASTGVSPANLQS
ncbi:protease complex subunit PrcB family protein [Paenibacillus sp. MZ04-78.2]|uniref:protease complex subunit PrcB family protein n=1 Tax=Paenibacillus sp. MZ04-78.2 TaxID=2962034 RepID=UPI0020B8C5B8|nr:protease complex subunit PrcB family protein [Paenibacillus sp. MZ04-78.2]MCP3775146.1 protease complex subunit PrcB family protein [Paenibacillus sp. MZ04-78.2]